MVSSSRFLQCPKVEAPKWRFVEVRQRHGWSPERFIHGVIPGRSECPVRIHPLLKFATVNIAPLATTTCAQRRAVDRGETQRRWKRPSHGASSRDKRL